MSKEIGLRKIYVVVISLKTNLRYLFPLLMVKFRQILLDKRIQMSKNKILVFLLKLIKVVGQKTFMKTCAKIKWKNIGNRNHKFMHLTSLTLN